MKYIDFSQPGGFPLTQDVLNYLQNGYTEAVTALAGARGTEPYILTGCTQSVAGTVISITPGYIFFNNELIAFVGGSIDTATFTGTQVAGFQVYNLTNTLIYNDGSSHIAQLEHQLTFGANADGTTTGTQFPLSALQPWLKDSVTGSLTVAGMGSPTGNIYYLKNYQSNSMRLYGNISLTNAQAVEGVAGGGLGPTYYELNILPVGYRPARSVPFTMYYRYHGAPILDDTGMDYIKMINAEVGTTGYIAAGWLKPAIGVASYSVYFDCTIPLD